MSVAALILAGGQSRRMGTDKALLSLQGNPMLQRVHDTADRCCISVYVLTPWPDRYRAILPASVQFLTEDPAGHGPLVALCQGLQLIKADWTLLLACDLPHLRAEILQHWISQLAHTPSTILARVPRQHRYWEPLCGFYSDQCQPALAEYILKGGRSFQGWLSQLPVEAIPVEAAIAPMLRNCNTPKDLKYLER